MLKEFFIDSKERNEIIDITGIIVKAVADCGIKSGHCIVYCPHTTAAIAINENSDPDVKADFLAYLQKLVPASSNFSHAEGNSDAHIKSAIIGNSRTIFIEEQLPVLGQWEGIFFCEFDGPRKRKFFVKIICE